MNDTRVTVTVTETITFEFPGYEARCNAHGQALCIRCARNPGDCVDPDNGGCSTYGETGMHWDSCPNRIR